LAASGAQRNALHNQYLALVAAMLAANKWWRQWRRMRAANI
jgi:hypothetical protein